MADKNGLKIALAKNATAIGPVDFWKAKAGGIFEVRGSWPRGTKHAQVYWRRFGEKDFSESRSLTFDVSGDGQLHTYQVKLSGSQEYKGNIVQLKLLLSDNDVPGTVTLRSVKILPH